MADTLNRLYSGISINQNGAADGSVTLATAKYQQFLLPDDHQRGGTVSPAITGIQIFVGVDALTAAITVRLEHKPFIGSWPTPSESALAEALATGAALVDDEVWLTCIFDEPISTTGLETDEFRIRLEAVSGVTKVWYSVPNPLSGRGNSKAYATDGTTAVQDTSRDVSFRFRLLTATADSGTDFLGNPYRSAVQHLAADLSDPTSSQDQAWMSGPQPSKFAVVAQYFDVQRNSESVVIDRVLLDPTTPGMWVHLYYCNSGDPGVTTADWEERVWTPVTRAYHALRRDTFILPAPIHARYVKLEYSHLQARSYNPGGFQQPITYQKHPKWVLDYFLIMTEAARQTAETGFVPRNVVITNDSFQLAFTYYQDDLISVPDDPPFLTLADRARVIAYLGERNDDSDTLTVETQNLITKTLNPYLADPRLSNVSRTLLGEVTSLNGPNHPLVEALPTDPAASTLVSSLNRDAVVFEQGFPVMFFYLACRHRYRIVTAPLSHDRAYFAGVREVAFTRERYSVVSDMDSYIETLGDHNNADVNDFLFTVIPTL